MTNINPKTLAREWAIQFLYQCVAEKLYHYSEAHFRVFAEHFQMPLPQQDATREMVRGTLDKETELDRRIEGASANWQLHRMPVIDRCILRLATWELTATDTPHKVVLNEAVDLAKKFGGSDSSRFVNGVLDRVAKHVGPEAVHSL